MINSFSFSKCYIRFFTSSRLLSLDKSDFFGNTILILPRTQTSLSICAQRKAGRRQRASPAVCTLPMVPCGVSPVTRFALASAMRKTKRLRRRLILICILNFRVIRELEAQLEYEREKREKLEAQMDKLRAQIHTLTLQLEDERSGRLTAVRFSLKNYSWNNSILILIIIIIKIIIITERDFGVAVTAKGKRQIQVENLSKQKIS